MAGTLAIRVLDSDSEIRGSFALMKALRPHLQADTFLSDVRTQQREGYLLVGGFNACELVAVAGYRFSRTLMRGSHLFVDDLVTADSARRRGHGAEMIAWLRRKAIDAGALRVYLDSRDTAVGFYERVGFTMMTSRTCWIDAR